MVTAIIKRDGREVPYDEQKIFDAIDKAVMATKDEPRKGKKDKVNKAKALVTEKVLKFSEDDKVGVEDIQDIVEQSLMEAGLNHVAKAYILYRSERTRKREMDFSLMKTLHDLTFVDSEDFNLKRENGNIDGDTAMGTMLRYGSEASKAFVDRFVLEPDMAEAHKNGDIHIHDKDFYMLTETCCQIDLVKLLDGGFSTGHGVLREPNGIGAYAALAAIAIQANQNDQHGGQSVPNFDYALGKGVAKTFVKEFIKYARIRIELLEEQGFELGEEVEDLLHKLKSVLMGYVDKTGRIMHSDGMDIVRVNLWDAFGKNVGSNIFEFAVGHATDETDKATYQAMEGLIHNLNTMNSRAGAQVGN